jgi:hypothetical protein
VKFFARVICGNLGAQFRDAPLDLLFGQKDRLNVTVQIGADHDLITPIQWWLVAWR